MKKVAKDNFSGILLGISILFYLFFALFDRAVICVDSPSYIGMESSREPFYPILIAFFRFIFRESGGELYLMGVVLVQSLLAAIAAYLLEEYFRREIGLSKIEGIFIFLIPLAVSLLCRFAARRGSMYSNSILTEGIAIPLYLIFFRYLLEYCKAQSRKSLLLCVFLEFLLISTRKQMYLTMLMLGAAILYVGFMSKKFRKTICILILSTAIPVGSSIFLDVSYNYLVRNTAVTHTGDSRFLATIAFYTASREDGEQIADEQMREAFYEVYDICEENGYLKKSAGKGWMNRVSHFGDYYDKIQIDTLWPAINQFVRDRYFCKEEEISKYADDVMTTISSVLIPHNFISVVQVFTDNFRSGLVTTVAQRNRILNWYTGFIYVVYLLLLFYHLKYVKDGNVILVAVATLLSILFNVALVSSVIFCQTRYTIYNMPLFYISLFLMAGKGGIYARANSHSPCTWNNKLGRR